MYAIRNKLTKQWLYGTDYREYHPVQRTSNNQAMLFETLDDAELEFRKRECNGGYEIIEVELRAIEDWPPKLIYPNFRPLTREKW